MLLGIPGGYSNRNQTPIAYGSLRSRPLGPSGPSPTGGGEILKRRRDSVPSTQYQVPLVRPRAESGERVAAAAGVGLVRVLDGEPGAHQPVAVVEDGALDHFGAGRVDDDLDVTEALDDVVLLDLGVEVHLVLEAAAATRPHRHTRGEGGLVRGSDQHRDLGLSGLGEGHCAIRLDVEDAGHVLLPVRGGLGAVYIKPRRFHSVP